MINVLTTCSVLMGKREEFKKTFNRIKELYEKTGAKHVGFWWTLGGEENEAVWMFEWESLTAYEEGKESVVNNPDYPQEDFNSCVILHTEKILK